MQPPRDADLATGLQTISRRVIRTLRRLGFLASGSDATVATGYAPRLVNEPERARPMAASVTQCRAGGTRAGENVRRIGGSSWSV